MKLDIEEIVVLMESIEALHKKVEATKKMVMENQAPNPNPEPSSFIPKLPSVLSATTQIATPFDEARRVVQASSVNLIPVERVALLPL
jgi:hypothetical protein